MFRISYGISSEYLNPQLSFIIYVVSTVYDHPRRGQKLNLYQRVSFEVYFIYLNYVQTPVHYITVK